MFYVFLCVFASLRQIFFLFYYFNKRETVYNDLLALIWIVIKILAIVLPLLVAVAYLTLMERKVIGYMQGRIGPNRVGPWGFLQPIADVLKMFFKEVIIPT